MTRACRVRGFSLLEMLVVIAIILLLIAILLPAFGKARESAKDAATRQFMGTLENALQTYYTDNENVFPNNRLVYGSLKLENPEALTQALLGYLDYSYDGAGPGNPVAPDGAFGFRVVAGGRSAIRGPYGPTESKHLKLVPNSAPARYTYVDARGYDIYYFRAVPRVLNGQTRTVTKVFDTMAGDPDASFQGLFWYDGQSTAVPSPAGGAAAFFLKLGARSNTDFGTGTIMGRENYLLLSPGQDAGYTTNALTGYYTADDVLHARP